MRSQRTQGPTSSRKCFIKMNNHKNDIKILANNKNTNSSNPQVIYQSICNLSSTRRWHNSIALLPLTLLRTIASNFKNVNMSTKPVNLKWNKGTSTHKGKDYLRMSNVPNNLNQIKSRKKGKLLSKDKKIYRWFRRAPSVNAMKQNN